METKTLVPLSLPLPHLSIHPPNATNTTKPPHTMEKSPSLNNTQLDRRSTDQSTDSTLQKPALNDKNNNSSQLAQDDPEDLIRRRRSLHSKVLIGGLVVTVVLGLALGIGLGMTVGRDRSS